ncbi:MAG: hypothetical protein KOO62_06870 [candidate division Zixibacteria bacterium]|nr:hypothetical protein [candidate division Zixibacteria bacterium]
MANTEASNRGWDEFNNYWTPTLYGDGGDSLLFNEVDEYEDWISYCGSREVADVGIVLHTTWLGGGDLQIDVAFAHGTPTNTVTAPSKPDGPAEMLIDTVGEYTVTGIDAEDDSLWYMWNWGDGEHSDWLGPYASGESCVQSHSYDEIGNYDITVVSKDYFHEAAPSTATSVNIICCIERGNVDYLGDINIGDLTYLVNFMFTGGEAPPCLEVGNVDAIGDINIGDLTYLVNFMFTGGVAPPPC